MSAFQIWSKQLTTYMQAEVEERTTFSDTSLLKVDSTSFGEGNLYKYRGYQRDTSTWQSPTGDTDAVASSASTWSGTSVVQRRLHLRKFEEFDALAGGATNVLESEAIILADHFVSNMEDNFFKNIIPAAFKTTGGSLTGTHLTNYSSSAFSADYVMEAAHIFGRPSLYKYLFVHPHVAKQKALWNYIDKEPVYNSSTPLRPIGNSRFIGFLHGLQVWTNDDMYYTGGVYDTYLMGDNVLYTYYQKSFEAKVGEDFIKAGGTVYTKYQVALASGIVGLTYNSTPTDIAGATDAEVATATNWSKISGLDNWRIPIVCLKSLSA